jgi:hypothetical protein
MTKIVFVGDSFTRHLFEAFVLILTQDYKFGALKPEGRNVPECADDGQFEEKQCRHFVNFNQVLCGGSVTADLDYGAWPPLTPSHSSYDLAFWSCGAHPVNYDYNTRYGVNDAAVVKTAIFEPLCRGDAALPWLKAGKPKVIWLLQHCRLRPKFPDEREEVVARYNKEAPPALKEVCGFPDDPIDFSFTCDLVHKLSEEANRMTWDGVHWSRAANLIKAQMLLERIALIGNTSSVTASV